MAPRGCVCRCARSRRRPGTGRPGPETPSAGAGGGGRLRGDPSHATCRPWLHRDITGCKVPLGGSWILGDAQVGSGSGAGSLSSPRRPRRSEPWSLKRHRGASEGRGLTPGPRPQRNPGFPCPPRLQAPPPRGTEARSPRTHHRLAIQPHTRTPVRAHTCTCSQTPLHTHTQARARAGTLTHTQRTLAGNGQCPLLKGAGAAGAAPDSPMWGPRAACPGGLAMGGDAALSGAPGPSNQRTRRFLGPTGVEGALPGLPPVGSRRV